MTTVWQAFSDESGLQAGSHYRSICVVSGRCDAVAETREELRTVIEGAKVTEVKFEKLKGHSPQTKATKGFLEVALRRCCRGQIRCNVLTWDMHDSRHKVDNIDDAENLKRMYHHLLGSVARAWDSYDDWTLFPDGGDVIEWDDVTNVINKTSVHKASERTLPVLIRHSRQRYGFAPCIQCDSKQEPLVQLCDLLAGASVYSRHQADLIQSYEERREAGENTFFGEDFAVDQLNLSKAHECRIRILSDFAADCRGQKLGVSLRTNGYLHSHNGRNAISFWNYKPQTHFDKAPVKRRAKGAAIK